MQILMRSALLSGAGDAILCMRHYLTAHPLECLFLILQFGATQKGEGTAEVNAVVTNPVEFRLHQCTSVDVEGNETSENYAQNRKERRG